MRPRYDVLILDIDEVLIDFHKSRQVITWIAGLDTWREYLTLLRNEAMADNRILNIGIATYKHSFCGRFSSAAKARGDTVSAAVLEEEPYYTPHNTISGLGQGLGLKSFINPDIVYFTEGMSKIDFGLNIVESCIRKKFPRASVDKKNIILMDDNPRTCQDALAAGFNSVCLGSRLSSLDYNLQKIEIAIAFNRVFEILGLNTPEKILMDGRMQNDLTYSSDEDEVFSEIDDPPVSENEFDELNYRQSSRRKQAKRVRDEEKKEDKPLNPDCKKGAEILMKKIRTQYDLATDETDASVKGKGLNNSFQFFASDAMDDDLVYNSNTNDMDQHEDDVNTFTL
jgi:hypothetical protein